MISPRPGPSGCCAQMMDPRLRLEINFPPCPYESLAKFTVETKRNRREEVFVKPADHDRLVPPQRKVARHAVFDPGGFGGTEREIDIRQRAGIGSMNIFGKFAFAGLEDLPGNGPNIGGFVMFDMGSDKSRFQLDVIVETNDNWKVCNPEGVIQCAWLGGTFQPEPPDCPFVMPPAQTLPGRNLVLRSLVQNQDFRHRGLLPKKLSDGVQEDLFSSVSRNGDRNGNDWIFHWISTEGRQTAQNVRSVSPTPQCSRKSSTLSIRLIGFFRKYRTEIFLIKDSSSGRGIS